MSIEQFSRSAVEPVSVGTKVVGAGVSAFTERVGKVGGKIMIRKLSKNHPFLASYIMEIIQDYKSE